MTHMKSKSARLKVAHHGEDEGTLEPKTLGQDEVPDLEVLAVDGED